jgi:hypothetical protein
MRKLLLVLLPLTWALLVTASRTATAGSAGGVADGATIQLSPDSGPPGTVVQIAGTYPGAAAGPTADTAPSHATICWNGCPSGLRGLGETVTWSETQPGRFTLQFTVPQAAWLEDDGVHALAPGDYAVGLQCLVPPGGRLVSGCALQPAVANATFHMTGPITQLCAAAECGSLQLTPATAAPGAHVQVSGLAPVAVLSGNGAFAYSLRLTSADGTISEQLPDLQLQQAPDGSLAGDFPVPLAFYGTGVLPPGAYTASLEAFLVPGPRRLAVASANVALSPAPDWSSIAAPPLHVDRGESITGPLLAADPTDPHRLAYCGQDGIMATQDGGASWTPVPVDDAQQQAAQTRYPLFIAPRGGQICLEALPAPGLPQGYYTVFRAADAGFGAPPIFFVAYETLDGGASWRPVPLPDGFSAVQFGGFQTPEGAVQALFSSPAPSGNSSTAPASAPPQPAIAVEQANGDGSWTSVSLGCPASGPCVRWGPGPNAVGSCAMNERVQLIERSTDAGRSFTPPEWPQDANACVLNELAALSPATELLLTGEEPLGFAVRVSTDGGDTWQAVTLPSLPDVDATQTTRFPGLQLLPDGSLLAQGPSSYFLLPPGAGGWCAVRAVPFSAIPQSVLPAGDRLHWMQPLDPPGGGFVAGSAPLTSVTCGA